MYKLLLFLHILCAIVGIGNYMLAGLRAAAAAKVGPPAPGAVGNAEYASGKVADLFIYGIFITAIALILVQDIDFGALWVSLSFLLYIVALGISHGLMKPAARKARELGASGGGAEMPSLQKRLAIGGTVLNVLGAVLLGLMIWQPA